METTKNYLLLFADLVGSTEVAVEASPMSYSRTYVASYHWAARRAHDFILDKEAFPRQQFQATIDRPRVAGDEVLSFTPMPDDLTLQQDIVASAVAFAYVTKLFWLVSPYNLQRILGKQFPRDVAVGIHIGPAVDVPVEGIETQIASLHINIAKRIEGVARDGRESRIFASYEVRDLYHKWVKRHAGVEWKHRAPLSYTQFVQRDKPQLVKGIPKPLQLFELEWNHDDDTHLRYILEQLHRSPNTNDVDTEGAARRMIEIFLPPTRPPFVMDGPEQKRQVDASYASADEYIKNWFDGIEAVNKLFFDEYWLVISSYLVSCGMLRHTAVTNGSRTSYVGIAEHVCDRLQELTGRAS